MEELKYPDDNPKYETRTPRQAAKDLADYRAQLAAQLDGAPLAEIAAPVAEQPQPEPAQQQQPQTSADLSAQAQELIRSENPQDRATGADLINQAAHQSAAERQQTADAVGAFSTRPDRLTPKR